VNFGRVCDFSSTTFDSISNSENDTQLRKLKTKICELEQMVGILTMEAYLFKKKKSLHLSREKKLHL